RGGLQGRVGTAVETTRLEAAVGRHVTHHPLAEGLLQTQRWRPRIPALAAAEGDGFIERCEDRPPVGTGRAPIVLLVARVAQAGGQRPSRGELPVDVRER